MYAELKHYLNPLHIFCRLRDMGISKGKAAFLCQIYEQFIFRPLLVKEPVISRGE